MVVEDVEQLDKLGGCLFVPGAIRMVIAAGVSGSVTEHCLLVLHRPIPPAVVVAAVPSQVTGVGVAAVAGQNVVKVEDRHVRRKGSHSANH